MAWRCKQGIGLAVERLSAHLPAVKLPYSEPGQATQAWKQTSGSPSGQYLPWHNVAI